MHQAKTGGGANLSRKEFLRLGGAGARRGGASRRHGLRGSEGGGNTLPISWGPDNTGALTKLIGKYNRLNKGKIQVSRAPG